MTSLAATNLKPEKYDKCDDSSNDVCDRKCDIQSRVRQVNDKCDKLLTTSVRRQTCEHVDGDSIYVGRDSIYVGR